MPGRDPNLAASAPLMLTGSGLTVQAVRAVARHGLPVAVEAAAVDRMAAARRLVFELAQQDVPVYGLNRGVGWNKDRRIDATRFADYNRNLLLSHDVGTGPEASEDEVRAVLLARLNGLLLGHAGTEPAIALRYAEFLNLRIHPVLHLSGSVGAADITSLSPIGLAMIGEGEVWLDGRRMSAAEALGRTGLAPLTLGPKDALAIVSSNALSAGTGALGLADTADILELADLASALSLEALGGQTGPLDPAVHRARPYRGQMASMRLLRAALEGSDLEARRNAETLQDPLSFRDVCQIHGAARDALAYTEELLQLQLNSSDDNPCVLPEEGRIVSCANFDPLVWVLGFEMLGGALQHVSRSSAYRMLKLGNPAFTGLSRFLSPDEERYIGFGTVQKTVSALDAEIRHLAQPASGDFLSLAGDIEDHATNAPYVVAKTRQIIRLLSDVLAVELLHAAQAVDLRGGLRLGRGTEAVYRSVRTAASFMAEDRAVSADIRSVGRLICDGSLLRAARAAMAD